MFGDPQKGDIFLQRAIILEEKTPPGNRKSFLLHISNEHGTIIEPKIQGQNVILMFEDIFEGQFVSDPALPETYIGKFKVLEYNPAEDIVYFCRLNKNGGSFEVTLKESKEKFCKTHCLEQVAAS